MWGFEKVVALRRFRAEARLSEASAFDACRTGCYYQSAGWSSLVARWAHNPKVGGSNPPPATNTCNHLGRRGGDFLAREMRRGRFRDLWPDGWVESG